MKASKILKIIIEIADKMLTIGFAYFLNTNLNKPIVLYTSMYKHLGQSQS